MVKKIIFIVILLNSTQALFSQSIKVGVQLKGGSTYIEKYQKFFEEKGYEFSDSYRLGPSASKKLKELINKAIEWANLNEEHMKEFEKSMGRIIVMNTQEYKNNGYSEFLAQELELIFYGNNNGGFNLKLCSAPCNELVSFLEFESVDELKAFYNMLSGKTISPEIDGIFK